MTKEQRLLKKVIKTKAMINELQDNLQLIFDKLRELGITEEELEGYGKITQVTSTRKNYDIKGLVEEIGQEIVDKYTNTTESTFYRVSIDKDFYKNN